jgi:cytochrome c6
VLARVDRILAPLTWLAAAALVVMLFAGPTLVADDKASSAAGAAGAAPYAGGGTGTAPDGRQVFVERCGTCHTLAAAATNGAVGPALNGAHLSVAVVARTVRGGRGAMPAFEGRLSDAQISAIASFVARASAG